MQVLKPLLSAFKKENSKGPLTSQVQDIISRMRCVI
jgi:hypothetical protein